MSALRVAIVGGGLGGLSAALALCAKGMHAQAYQTQTTICATREEHNDDV